MNRSADHSQVLSTLEKTVCSNPDIVFAIVFGSQISEDSTQSSDFDLAIKFADELSAGDRFEKHCFLSGDLQHEALPFIDVSDIESLPLAVAHDAMNGELLYGDQQAFEQFRTAIEEKFDEQHESLRRQQQAVIDRIAEDGLRG